MKKSANSQHESLRFGLSNTFFVMILLVTASLMFTNDANRLVLRPVGDAKGDQMGLVALGIVELCLATF